MNAEIVDYDCTCTIISQLRWRQRFVWFSFVLLLPTVAYGSGPGPNAPAGTTVLVENTFTAWDSDRDYNFDQGGGWRNVLNDGRDCFVTSDAGAPGSPPSVLRQHRAPGSKRGGCSLIHEQLGNSGTTYATYPRIYGKIVFKHSNPFYGVAAGYHKLTGYLGQQNSANNIGPGLVVGHYPDSLILGPWFNGPADNCHLLGVPGFIQPPPEECAIGYRLEPKCEHSGAVTLGMWHTMEFILQLGTCASCKNGMIIWYLDGVKIGDWRAINHAQTNGVLNEFDSWRITHTWDGQDMENKDVESWIDIDEVWLGTFPAGAHIP